jgi:hypothetical protein
MPEAYFRVLVHRAGGLYVGIRHDSVCFRAHAGAPMVSLKPWEIKSPGDVLAALKKAREQNSPVAKEKQNA